MPFLSEEVIDRSQFTKKIAEETSENCHFVQKVTNRTKTKSYSICSKEFCEKIVEIFKEDNNEDELKRILNGNTDLIPNQYEGGFKVWEGLWDLVDYLERSTGQVWNSILELNSGDEENNINILDLGCGSGLLSIYIAEKLSHLAPNRPFTIYLQDYNENVIKYFTIPNVILNCQDNPDKKNPLENFQFLYGDWELIESELLERSIRFDLILTAETLYSEDNYGKLVSIFERLLRPRSSSQVLVASKSHYFGVGGGTYSFIEFLEQNQKKKNKMELKAEIVEDIEAALLRHIIRVSRSC